MKRQLTSFTLSIFCTLNLQALPIDWHGSFGVDTTSIDNYRRIESLVDNSNFGNANGRGTQEIPLALGKNPNANWQSYIFQLEPTIIINDAATVKAELTSGYARGGLVGDDNSQAQEPGFGNALYSYNFSSGSDSIVLNKLYMEIYSDTATYVIGRHDADYGLGAVVNSGSGLWDRLSFTRDGITVKIKIGNFNIEPFWSRAGSNGSLTKSTRTKEIGFALKYDNIEQDVGFGVLHSNKKSAASAQNFRSGTDEDLPDPDGDYGFYTPLGKTNVKLTSLFFRKKFRTFDFGLEIPLIGGEIGNAFDDKTKYKAKAILFESSYKVNQSFTLNLYAGKVDGDSGSGSNFEAMYLNPNYHIANLLFRYNLRAVSRPTGTNARNVYDSYIHNATFLKFGMTYQTGRWFWDTAVIWAKAQQVAKAGKFAYNHLTNKRFLANFSQKDDLGYEVDVNFNYQWNNEISIRGAFGYLETGGYFGYTNSDSENVVDSSFVVQLNTAVTF